MSGLGRTARERREYARARYPGTDTLRNRLDLRTAEALAAAELLFVADRLAQGLPSAARRLTPDGLKAIHLHLFQDIYDWAGEFRTYTAGRGQAPFARPEFIEPSLRDLFASLRSEENLVGLEPSDFALRAAFFVNEINAIHPFIEGNGRMQRVWLRILADAAGYRLKLGGQDKDAWNEASRRGFHGDHELMAALIARSVQAM